MTSHDTIDIIEGSVGHQEPFCSELCKSQIPLPAGPELTPFSSLQIRGGVREQASAGHGLPHSLRDTPPPESGKKSRKEI